MKDWRQIALGNKLDIPEADLGRIAPALDSMEEVFRSLVGGIPPDIEPAVIFHAAEGAE